MDAYLNILPREQKKKVLIERKIKQVHQQFSSCVDPFILNHVNSVYLTKEDLDVSRETHYKLTVYVDNSLVAAELNAQRELVVLKYRELYSLKISEFLIRISRGPYLDNYPFRKEKEQSEKKIHRLTPDEELEIQNKTEHISDNEIRQSFQRALKAIKEHPIKE
jgi:hypothetical protein